MSNTTPAQKEARSPASSQRRVELSSTDLPLHCPRAGERIWDAHPRVFIPIDRGQEVQCPYCGTLYHLPE